MGSAVSGRQNNETSSFVGLARRCTPLVRVRRRKWSTNERMRAKRRRDSLLSRSRTCSHSQCWQLVGLGWRPGRPSGPSLNYSRRGRKRDRVAASAATPRSCERRRRSGCKNARCSVNRGRDGSARGARVRGALRRVAAETVTQRWRGSSLAPLRPAFAARFETARSSASCGSEPL